MGGIEKSNIYQYFKVLYGLGNICLGGGSSYDMEFGASNCMFEFSTLMHIMCVRSDKYVGSLIAELILSLIYMCIILCGLVHNYFLGWGSSEDVEFGAGNCMCEFSTMMHII